MLETCEGMWSEGGRSSFDATRCDGEDAVGGVGAALRPPRAPPVSRLLQPALLRSRSLSRASPPGPSSSYARSRSLRSRFADSSLGTAISIVYDTSLQTSDLHHVHNTAPLRAAYFARKGNFFNRVFVKRAWGWTAIVYLLHLATSPGTPSVPSAAASVGKINPALHSLPYNSSPRRSRGQRFAALVLASLAWILFTAWCFGAGLGDRIIAMSGGTCSVPLPQGVVDVGALEPLLPEGHTTMILHAPPHDPRVGAPRAPERVYLPLHSDFCARRLPLDTKTHPRLFALLSAAHDAQEEIHRALHLPPPRWSGGFDVSGHAFLLTLGVIVLAAELAPSWRAALAERRGVATRGPGSGAGKGVRGIVHVLSTVAGTALIGLWVWMLFMTAVYFHHTHEKLAGFGEYRASWRSQRASLAFACAEAAPATHF